MTTVREREREREIEREFVCVTADKLVRIGVHVCVCVCVRACVLCVCVCEGVGHRKAVQKSKSAPHNRQKSSDRTCSTKLICRARTNSPSSSNKRCSNSALSLWKLAMQSKKALYIQKYYSGSCSHMLLLYDSISIIQIATRQHLQLGFGVRERRRQPLHLRL
jgi:hypothetical protein